MFEEYLFQILSFVFFLILVINASRFRIIRLLVDNDSSTQFHQYQGVTCYGIILKFWPATRRSSERMLIFWLSLGITQVWMAREVYWNGWCWEETWHSRKSEPKQIEQPHEQDARILTVMQGLFQSTRRKIH